ncbi:MAG: tripartite tricarboxylate transporter TctB family protein [Candidatus Methylomirabilota bacterium]
MRMTRDRWAGLLFFVASLFIMVESLRLSIDEINNPGPGFMPFVVGLILAFLSILCFVVLGKEETPQPPQEDGEDGRRVITLIGGGLVLYVPAVMLIGFYGATFLLVLYLMKLAGERGYRRGLVISLVTIGVVYFLFERVLYIPFPKGMLGI